MKKLIHLVTIIILLNTPAFAKQGLTQKKSASLNHAIEQILESSASNLNVGILVKDISSGQTLYQNNADHYFLPASNEKLFTAYAALRTLGPDYVYQTRLYVDKEKIQNGVLNDNLYLQFSGDPALTLDQLDQLIHALTLAGIQQINGSVVIDDNAFDQVTMSPGTVWEDYKFCFGSPVSAITINHNCVYANLSPATVLGAPALLTLPQQPQFINFINQVVTQPANTNKCKLKLELTNDTTYTLRGCISADRSTKTLQIAIKNPKVYANAALLYLFKKNNISVNPAFQFQPVPISAKLFMSYNSVPVKALVTTMLKISDNTIANSLFKTIGSVYAKNTGTWENGKEAMHQVLSQNMQLNIPSTTLIDGAGGSRYNYLTPRQIVTLLHKVSLAKDATIFISALPISGVDGTLETRMNSKELAGNIQAKTGTERAVTALSGYINTKRHHRLVFSIMVNGIAPSPEYLKILEDKICAAIYQHG